MRVSEAARRRERVEALRTVGQQVAVRYSVDGATKGQWWVGTILKYRKQGEDEQVQVRFEPCKKRGVTKKTTEWVDLDDEVELSK